MIQGQLPRGVQREHPADEHESDATNQGYARVPEACTPAPSTPFSAFAFLFDRPRRRDFILPDRYPSTLLHARTSPSSVHRAHLDAHRLNVCSCTPGTFMVYTGTKNTKNIKSSSRNAEHHRQTRRRSYGALHLLGATARTAGKGKDTRTPFRPWHAGHSQSEFSY